MHPYPPAVVLPPGPLDPVPEREDDVAVAAVMLCQIGPFPRHLGDPPEHGH